MTVFKDENGAIWEQRKAVKNGKTYYSSKSLNQTTYQRPEGLTATGEKKKEYWAPEYPDVVKWAEEKAETCEVKVNCFPAKLTKSLYRYEVLDLEERNKWGTKGKLFPKALSKDAKKQIRNQLMELFGRNFVICDGFLVSDKQHDKETAPILTIEAEEYVIEIRNHGEVLQKGSDITTEPEKYIQMLMYGLHQLAEDAGFHKDAHQGKTVFWKHSASDENQNVIRQRGADWSAPDVMLHRVYHLKMGVGIDPNSGDKNLFAFADISHKHLAARSLRELIRSMEDKHENKEDYRQAVESAFLRKRALVKYSSCWIKVEKIMWDDNEDFKFEAGWGDAKKETSIKDYLASKYSIQVKDNAPCLIKCSFDSFRGKKWGEFLPQHLYVTVNKERTKEADPDIKNREAMNGSDRIKAVQKFVQQFEEVQNPKFPLQISGTPLKIKAQVFPEINLKIKRESYSLRDFKDGWARNRDGFTEDSDEDAWGEAKNIAILSTRRNERAAAEIKEKIDRQYLGKRGINDLIKKVECTSMRDYTENDISDAIGELRNEPDIVIAIIEDGKEGSEQKAVLARASQGKYRTQCMVGNKVRKNAAVLGMLDDVMAKLGGCWYQVDYGFETIQAQDFWTIGIDVYCSQSDSAVSGLSVQLCHNIAAGSMKNYIRGNLPLHPRETIAPKDAMREVMKEVFRKAKEKGLQVPKTILVFRGGVSMGEIDLLRTNEVAATIQAIYQIFGKSGKKRLSYFLVPRGGTIRFDSQLRKPICVTNTITGGFYQNFYTQINTIARKTPRVVQYICLYDDGYLQKILAEAPSDWLKMIRGLCYLYPQSISFYNGPCSYPGPLKCAQNQAENFTQAIFKTDQKLEDCDKLPNSLTALFNGMNLVDEEMTTNEENVVKAESTKPVAMETEHDRKEVEMETAV